MLSKISQSEKDKYHMFSYMWNLMNELQVTSKIETDSQRTLWKLQGRVGVRGWRELSEKENRLTDVDNSAVIAGKRRV